MSTIWYHGTKSLKARNEILTEGFEKTYGNYGEAAYFTSLQNLAEEYGDFIIKIKLNSKARGFLVKYHENDEIYPDMACGMAVTEFQEIAEKYNYNYCIIEYTDADRELVVFDTKIINIIE